MQKIVSLLFLLLSFTSCYYQVPETSDAWNLTEQQIDSISFYTTHHYSQNFNFLVRSDSLELITQHPSEYLSDLQVDTIYVYEGNRLVVADITTMPADADSVWVRVARDQETIGWVHEKRLLQCVTPDTPISLFIDFFSDTHLLIGLAILVLGMVVFLFRKLLRLGAKMVYLNDIPSFFPMALCLLVAASAVLYSSIQLFAPDSWRHYYYHPTLNPFAVPFHLSVFLMSVWLLLLVAVATADDLRRQLRPGELFFYVLSLAGWCAVIYVIFSVSTLYYLGYPLFLAYVAASLWWYRQHRQPLYTCGKCGQPIPAKGRCPHCGALNV